MTNAAVMLDVLAEPTRRLIVERLIEQPASATDIARTLPISRSAISQHLQVLKSVGLVHDQAAGTRRIYHVEPDALAAIRAYFDDFWQRSMTAFRHAAERPEERPCPKAPPQTRPQSASRST